MTYKADIFVYTCTFNPLLFISSHNAFFLHLTQFYFCWRTHFSVCTKTDLQLKNSLGSFLSESDFILVKLSEDIFACYRILLVKIFCFRSLKILSYCFIAFFFSLVLLKKYIFQHQSLEYSLCLWLHTFTVVFLGGTYFPLNTLGLYNIFSLMLCSWWKILIIFVSLKISFPYSFLVPRFQFYAYLDFSPLPYVSHSFLKLQCNLSYSVVPTCCPVVC